MRVPDDHEKPSWMVVGLLFLGVFSRLIPHPWNVTPVCAIALFGGTYLGRAWSLWLPLAAVAASDLLLGLHATIPFTWGAFLLAGLLGWWVRRRATAGRVIVASLAGSCLFFVITNFGVWWVGGLYPKTAAGLAECFTAAIPFFRGTVIGDLSYTAILFSLGHLVFSARAAAAHAD